MLITTIMIIIMRIPPTVQSLPALQVLVPSTGKMMNDCWSLIMLIRARVVYLVALILHSIALHRHRKAGLHAMPGARSTGPAAAGIASEVQMQPQQPQAYYAKPAEETSYQQQPPQFQQQSPQQYQQPYQLPAQ